MASGYKLVATLLALISLGSWLGCGKQASSPVGFTPAKSPAYSPAQNIAAVPASDVQLTSFNAAAPDVNWPGFRGPSGMGITEAKGLPTNWGKDENIAWKVDMPGPGASSPIVFGDRIYITAYSGFFVPGQDGSQEDLKRHLIALNRKDGSLIWEQKVPAKLPEENRIRDHGFAASTAAADIERLCVLWQDGSDCVQSRRE
jgi:hypothetical protein